MSQRLLKTLIAIVLVGCVAGCGKEDPQESIELAGAAVRRAIEGVKRQLPKRLVFPMGTAASHLEMALEGLPLRVEEKAQTRLEERKAAAQRAKEFYQEKIRPALSNMQYDEDQVRADLDELAKIIDEVERP